MSSLGEPDSSGELTAPDYATAAFYDLWMGIGDVISMAGYVYEMNQGLASLAKAARGLEGVELPDEPADNRMERTHYKILLQLLLTRCVDSLLTYVSASLVEIFLARPETLRPGDQKFPVELILDHDDMPSLVRSIAEDRVNQLAYKSVRDLAQEVAKRTGIRLFADDDELAKVVEIVEVRNIIAHNNGRVSKLTVKRLPKYSDQLGKQIDITGSIFSGVPLLIMEIAFRFDAKAVEKFNLAVVNGDTYFETVHSV